MSDSYFFQGYCDYCAQVRLVPGKGGCWWRSPGQLCWCLELWQGKREMDSRTLQEIKAAGRSICLDIVMREGKISGLEDLAYLEYLICKGSGRE